MNLPRLRAFSFIPLIAFLGAAVLATDFRPKTDNEIVALDLRSGEVLWTHKPAKLSDAHFEVYEQGVVAYPHYSGDMKSDAIFLHPTKGTLIQPFKTDSAACLAKSSVFDPLPTIQLSNGWVLQGFTGYKKPLTFLDPQTKQTVWSIPGGKTGGYPGALGSWKDYVFFAFHWGDEGIIYACEAGKEKPNWTADLNEIVRDRMRSLTRPRLQVIDGTIYVAANEHIFAFEPETGKLRWQRDLSKDLNLPFGGGVFGGAEGGFFGGNLNLAVFAKSGDILIVAFEKRVVALDLKSMQYLWHLSPDTFPHCPFPAAHNGKVFLSSGAKRQLFKVKEGTGSSTNTIDSGKK